MRKHNGMRPQDVVILLKLFSIQGNDWQLQPLSNSLRISTAEISLSLNRSKAAGLVDYSRKRPNRLSIIEFLVHGVKYVFPQEPGRIIRGMLTAHSHPFMKEHIRSENNYVWADHESEFMGESIEPFYEKQIDAAKEDPLLYKLLALVDVIRVGRAREVAIAKDELNRMLSQ
jgi:hypothetical protein